VTFELNFFGETAHVTLSYSYAPFGKKDKNALQKFSMSYKQGKILSRLMTHLLFHAYSTL
jgi:hypothetical protein